MGGIADEHVEWAVVNRLKAMRDEPPKTKFNVTQSFALFSWYFVQLEGAAVRGLVRLSDNVRSPKHSAHDPDLRPRIGPVSVAFEIFLRTNAKIEEVFDGWRGRLRMK
jgi:hypothetical protein